MPQLLTEIDLDEVSLVDKGANQHAKVVLMKKDSPICKAVDCPNKGMYEGTCKKANCPMQEVDKCGDDGDCEQCKAMFCVAHVAKAPSGVQFNLGFKEDNSSEIQSVVFDKEVWDTDKAKKWLTAHKLSSSKVDDTENTLRYRQKDPDGYTKFRMITPGKEISKALRAKQALSQVHAAVDRALREKFETKTKGNTLGPYSYVYVRDLFKDDAIIETEGKTYRISYGVSRTDDGELEVTLGDKIPVEVVYQDIVAKNEARANSICARLLSLRTRLSIHKMNTCHNQADGKFCSSGGKGGVSSSSASDKVVGRLGSLKIHSKGASSAPMSSAAEGVGNVLSGTKINFRAIHTSKGVSVTGSQQVKSWGTATNPSSGKVVDRTHSILIKPNGSWTATISEIGVRPTNNRGKGVSDMKSYIDRWNL